MAEAPRPKPNNDNTDTQRALRLFVILNRCQHSLLENARADIQGHGLNATEFGVLEALYHKGDLPLGELAQRILIATGSLTYVVDKLERQGLILRRSCPSDRRVCYASLTPQGEALISELFPKHAQALKELLSVLSPEEQESLAQSLKRLGLAAQTRLANEK